MDFWMTLVKTEAAAAISWLGLWFHNRQEFPDMTLAAPDTAVPLVITLILAGLWAIRPGPVLRWLTLAWLGLNLLGAVVTVLPLGMLPFDPEQSWAHYSSHLVYALAQLPWLWMLIRHPRQD
jgi:hypothetical protein